MQLFHENSQSHIFASHYQICVMNAQKKKTKKNNLKQKKVGFTKVHSAFLFWLKTEILGIRQNCFIKRVLTNTHSPYQEQKENIQSYLPKNNIPRTMEVWIILKWVCYPNIQKYQQLMLVFLTLCNQKAGPLLSFFTT